MQPIPTLPTLKMMPTISLHLVEAVREEFQDSTWKRTGNSGLSLTRRIKMTMSLPPKFICTGSRPFRRLSVKTSRYSSQTKENLSPRLILLVGPNTSITCTLMSITRQLLTRTALAKLKTKTVMIKASKRHTQHSLSIE